MASEQVTLNVQREASGGGWIIECVLEAMRRYVADAVLQVRAGLLAFGGRRIDFRECLLTFGKA